MNDEHLRQLEVDDAVVGELIEDLAVLKGSSGVVLGITWHERFAKLSADQLLDVKNVVDRALSLRA